MKIAFMSYVIGSKRFIDMAIVTIMSYLETNLTEVDWLIFGDTDDDLKCIKDRLSFIKDNQVHIKVLPFTNIEDNVNFVNHKGWITDLACTMFYKRIKLIDKYKKDYDLLVMVDLDIIFVGGISAYLQKAYNDDNVWISGQEQNNPEEDIIKLNNNQHYINFGFAILKCSKLRDNEFDHLCKFLDTPNIILSCQDQSYYNSSYPADKYFVYQDLQLCEWNFQWFKRIKPQYKIYHYSPMRYMDQNKTVIYNNKANENIEYGWSVISLLAYDKYAECTERYKQYLSGDFLKNVKLNNQRFLNERNADKISYYCYKRRYRL